ncbi:hypothetical protein MNBD_GAMMA13-1131 [hydrothermal vent metagenome]|uniref:Uncharacterized protein n=1 Tax=hydrothermal vent metagenome TaxID=652676 RepID=A0A3B0Z4I6_9ZZZZ
MSWCSARSECEVIFESNNRREHTKRCPSLFTIVRIDITVASADSNSWKSLNCPCSESSFIRKDIRILPTGKVVHVLVKLVEKAFWPMIDVALLVKAW